MRGTKADRRFGDPVEFVEVRHVPMPGQGVKTVLVDGYRVARDGQGRAGVHGAAQERVLAGEAARQDPKCFEGLAPGVHDHAVARSSMVVVAMVELLLCWGDAATNRSGVTQGAGAYAKAFSG
ncbi:hypothetical protein [Streptomyces sp. NPDC051286]|uniref:hypothetical protein n=1 Tax=Streptomyces sp. NPDC051286 TaxID=3365647 RepID=UPI0037B65057